jgi:hypothetical protein
MRHYAEVVSATSTAAGATIAHLDVDMEHADACSSVGTSRGARK